MRDYFELFESFSQNVKIKKNQKYQMILILFANELNRIFNKNKHILISFDLFESIINFNDFAFENNKKIREKMILIDSSKNVDANELN